MYLDLTSGAGRGVTGMATGTRLTRPAVEVLVVLDDMTMVYAGFPSRRPRLLNLRPS